jgi:hypothetical protein
LAVFGSSAKITYAYDKADNWQHIIECKDGYYEFIEVMKNPKHEEYDSMKECAESVNWRGFDLDRVNCRLRYLVVWLDIREIFGRDLP